MIPDVLLLGLSLLNLLLLAAIGTVTFRVRRRLRLVRQDVRRADRQAHRHRLLSQIASWQQIEALLSLYRFLDRPIELPAMRFGPVSPDFMLHIIERIRRDRPKSIVECGAGSSTIVLAHMLRALGIDSHVYAIENYAPSLESVRRQLREHDLESFVTIVAVPLVEKFYAGFDTSFQWYGLDPGVLPAEIDLLIVDGPHGSTNRHARYPAGPELLPKLSPGGRVFVDDADRGDEQEMVRLWLESHPELAKRNLKAEKGCIELFFPDHAIEREALPAH